MVLSISIYSWNDNFNANTNINDSIFKIAHNIQIDEIKVLQINYETFIHRKRSKTNRTMKTLEEIKNEVAKEYSYESYDDFKNLTRKIDTDIVFVMDEFFNKVAKRYAKEVAIASLEKASENAKLKTFSTKNLIDFSKKMVDKSSITNEENIVL